jgi:hypothetical protein
MIGMKEEAFFDFTVLSVSRASGIMDADVKCCPPVPKGYRPPVDRNKYLKDR